MKTSAENMTEIKNAVASFMGSRRVCWATPGTKRHSANFYGDTVVCRFTRAQLINVIEMFHENYGGVKCNADDSVLTLSESISAITSEMQFEKPSDE